MKITFQSNSEILGLHILAAMQQGIPVIAVKENANRMQNDLSIYTHNSKLIIMENYLEAAGVTSALKGGISISSLKRPLENTRIIQENLMSGNQTSASFAERVLSDIQ